MNGLPGIEVLFREHQRLANKLTKDELKSIKTYIHNRLVQENEELLFEYNELKSSHNTSIAELRETIQMLQKELAFKNDIIKNYKSSEENLSNVYKKRGERLERRHSVLLENHEANRETVKLFEMRIRNMQKELEELQDKVIEQNKELNEREQVIRHLKESQDNVVNSEKLSKDLLKVKLAVDEKEREYQKVRRQNEDLTQQIETYKQKLSELQKKMDKIQGEFDDQKAEYRSKCEKLAALHYQLDLEKKRSSDLQKELEDLQDIAGMSPTNYPDNHSARDYHREAPSYRAESMRAQVQFLEGRVKLLEERLALYRTSVRDSTKEVGIIANDSKRLEQLLERLVIHESPAIEQTLVDLRESIDTRRSILEESVDDILQQIPAAISKEAAEVRSAVLNLKRQSEVGRVGDVTIRCTRLFPRIEACEKAQFGNYEKIINRNWKEHAGPTPKYFTKHRRSIDHTYTGLPLPKKQPSVPLLIRSKTQNGTLPLNKRKHSVSMDSVVIPPTVFDLSVGPGPSPRMKDTQPKTAPQSARPLSAFLNQPIIKASR